MRFAAVVLAVKAAPFATGAHAGLLRAALARARPGLPVVGDAVAGEESACFSADLVLGGVGDASKELGVPEQGTRLRANAFIPPCWQLAHRASAGINKARVLTSWPEATSFCERELLVWRHVVDD